MSEPEAPVDGASSSPDNAKPAESILKSGDSFPEQKKTVTLSDQPVKTTKGKEQDKVEKEEKETKTTRKSGARPGFEAPEEWDQAQNVPYRAQKGMWNIVRFFVLLLSMTHFFRTSWTIQSMFKSGAKYAEQWAIYSEKYMRQEKDQLLVYREGGYLMHELSERMQMIHRLQLSEESFLESETSTVFMQLMEIDHTEGNNRCSKMRGTYKLKGGDEWKHQWLVFLREETMLIATGEKTFEGADARTKSFDPVSLVSEGFWATRRSMDLRTLGGLESIGQQLPDGEVPINGTNLKFTLPGNRFNLKSTCLGCEDAQVLFTYYCDIEANFTHLEDQTILKITSAKQSSRKGLTGLGMGLSVVWTWRMTAGDVCRGLAQLVMIYYFFMLQGYGLLPSKLYFNLDEEDTRRFSVKGFLRRWNLLPERIGQSRDGVPPYFFQHNSWLMIFLNVLALCSDSLITIAYIRETSNYALYQNKFWPVYWMCIYGLRFMWVYLFCFKLLKIFFAKLQWPLACRALTCVWYNYMPATLLAMFVSEDITLKLYGQEVEFEGLSSIADVLSVSFMGSFFVIRILPYILTLAIFALPMCAINFAVNSFTLKNSNTMDIFIIEKSSCVCGTVGIPRTARNPETHTHHYVTDGGTLLHIAWIINNALVQDDRKRVHLSRFSKLYRIAPASMHADEMTDEYIESILESKSRKTSLCVEFGIWKGNCTVLLAETNKPMVSSSEALAVAFSKPTRNLHSI